MSARFTTNFLILLLGAGLVIATFAFSHTTSGWVALGVGCAGVLVAAHIVRELHLGRRLDTDPLQIELARLAHRTEMRGHSSAAHGGAGARS